MVISAAAKRCGYDERHWTTQDGHRDVPVPAEVPVTWRQRHDGQGRLIYFSGPYRIVRRSYGTKYSYAPCSAREWNCRSAASTRGSRTQKRGRSGTPRGETW